MVVGGNDRCWTSYFHSLDVVTTVSISAALRRCCRNPSRGRHHLMYLRSLGTRTINKLNRAEELGSAAPATFPTFRKCLIVSMAGAPRATQRESSSSTTSHLTGDGVFLAMAWWQPFSYQRTAYAGGSASHSERDCIEYISECIRLCLIGIPISLGVI